MSKAKNTAEKSMKKTYRSRKEEESSEEEEKVDDLKEQEE